MDPNEIFEYATEGIKWLAVGGGTYIGTLLGCQIFDGTPFHKKITSQEELEIVVQNEAEKLGLDPFKIDAKYRGITNGARKNGARKNGERYDLQLIGGWQATRNSVRHELYHILKDCDKGQPNIFNYLFLAEPRATLYGTSGIKL